MSDLKIWISSFFATSGLALTVALFLVPSHIAAVVALTAVTILLTILTPLAVVPKSNRSVGTLLIGALYGLFWPLGLPMTVAILIINSIPDKPKNEILPEHNQGS